jgi:hypothetical protein
MKEVKSSWEDFWHSLKVESEKILKDNQGLSFSDAQIIEKRFNENIRLTEEKIKTIKSLKETDNAIALKKTILSYLTSIKNSQERSIPAFLISMKNNFEAPDQKTAKILDRVIFEIDALDQRNEQINYAFFEYRRKHNIQAHELENYHLY